MPARVATKVAALLDRPDSLPGRKDRQELHTLLALPGAGGATAVIKAASQRTPAQVAALIGEAFVFMAGDRALTDKTGRGSATRLGKGNWRWAPPPLTMSRQALAPTVALTSDDFYPRTRFARGLQPGHAQRGHIWTKNSLEQSGRAGMDGTGWTHKRSALVRRRHPPGDDARSGPHHDRSGHRHRHLRTSRSSSPPPPLNRS